MKHNRLLRYADILTIIFWIMIGPLLAACNGEARPKPITIGVVNTAASVESYLDGFKAGMAELGYVEGENLTYIYDGPVNEEEVESVVQFLLEQKVDLIFAIGEEAARPLKRAADGTDVPVIFAPFLNPVASGLVESITRPGGNVTGVQLSDYVGKKLEWLVTVAPNPNRVYVLHDPGDVGKELWLEGLNKAAPALGVEIVVSEVSSKEELTAALANIPEGVDAIFALPTTLLFVNTDQIVRTALEQNLPLAVSNGEQVQQGALVAYGTDRQAVGKQAAKMADQVLKGTSPGDLPVETAEYFLVINLKTAEAIGLDIPNSILRQADTIIR